jgi:hypothetical protein
MTCSGRQQQQQQQYSRRHVAGMRLSVLQSTQRLDSMLLPLKSKRCTRRQGQGQRLNALLTSDV